MVQNTLIARTGRGLLDVLTLLTRGAGAVLSVFGSFVLFAWGTEEGATDTSEKEPREVNGEEAKSYGWDSY